MRAFLIITGMIMVGTGVFTIANGGLTFISVAFIIGIALILSGLALTLSYKRINGETDETVHWVSVEGITSIVLGIIVLTGFLAADIAVQAVFGFWVMISGIRSMVVYVAGGDKSKFHWPTIIAVLEFVIGVLSFFNFEILQVPVLFLVGFCMVVQGVDSIRIGIEMTYIKPDAIKSKEELVADAEEAVQSAKADVHEAIQTAKEAKETLQEVKEAPSVEEVIEEPIEYEKH